MEDLDIELQSIRFTDPVLELLRNAGVTSVESLLKSDSLLTEVRAHLKPIQLVKLNKLIKDNVPMDCKEENGTNQVYGRTRMEILRERAFEQQCVEELNRMTDAPEAFRKLVKLYQSRVDRMSLLLSDKERGGSWSTDANLKCDIDLSTGSAKNAARNDAVNTSFGESQQLLSKPDARKEGMGGKN